MMETLLALLQSTGLEVAYRAWKVAPPLPYLVYLFTNSADLIADDVNYAEVSDWQVELYSVDKDTASEEAVETALKGAKIPYEKHETYIDTQKLHQVVYLIRTI